MKLSALLTLTGINFKAQDADVDFITDDSRKCRENSVFVCRIPSEEFAAQALKNGAVLIVAEERLCGCCAVVPSAARAYAQLCREFFGRPDERLRMIAVTGTNGKTSVSTMLHFLLTLGGKRAGLIGTVVNKLDEEKEALMTTPDCFELFSMLHSLCESGRECCVVEASSQGITEGRLYGIEFDLGIFTNLGEDHFDFHQSFENYKNAKLSLFRHCKTAVINFDDPYSDEFSAACGGRVITYSVKSDESDFTAKNIVVRPESVSYALVANSLIHTFTLPLRGDIWVKNSMAAIISAYHLGVSLDSCAAALRSFEGVRGRMEPVVTSMPFEVIIDYAHTADGIRQVLLSLRRQCRGRLIAVFGCGGDRERQKRAKMGNAVCMAADVAVVTTDNPRTEDPQQIIDDILEGTRGSKTPVYIKPDRKKAIEFALKLAKRDDIVLLAGKGHEQCQIVGKEKLPFDEREIVKSILGKQGKDCLL